jgi:seryl-tRNA synthetase
MGIKEQLSERLKSAEQTDKHLKTEAEIRRSEAQAQRLRDQTRIQNEQLKLKAGKELKNSATAPSTKEISDASTLLLNAYPGLRQDKVEQEIDGKPTTKFPSLAAASVIVAADAKKRMQANPALRGPEGWKQAAYQSIYAHKNSFQDIGKTTKFIGGGDSADEALPVPKSVIEDRDPAALTKDKFYELPSGRVGRWTGTGFVFDDDTPPDEEE